MTALEGEPSPAPVEDTGLTVLVVEDDDGDALLVAELLHIGLPNAEVLRARDLAEAHAALDGPVDCVLLDLGLPDAHTGTEAVEQLLDGRSGVAVVVVTGADDQRMGVQAVARGAQDFLVKGQLDELVLTRSILYAVERRRAEESALRLFEAERRRADNARMERALLPTPLVSSEGVDLAVAYRPGSQGATLGGDFYDAVELPSGQLRVVMGDVSGHGPDEAALGATLRSAWRALVLAGFPTPEVLGTVDRLLRTERVHAHAFVTLCMVDVDPDHRRADITLAGHPAPVLLAHDGTAGPVGEEARGPLLGVLEGATWRPWSTELPPRWSLLVYTDGLIEGRADPGSTERLGERRALEILERHRASGAAGSELIHSLVAEVESRHGGPLTDDVAVCLVGGAWR
jgi:serine phosphatase RsbU (regulator of sigma subunit)